MKESYTALLLDGQGHQKEITVLALPNGYPPAVICLPLATSFSFDNFETDFRSCGAREYLLTNYNVTLKQAVYQ